MAENFDLVLLHGPAFGGRTQYIIDHLKESHTQIIPRKIFIEDTNIGLRDIILRVISLLKQNKRVVVNDENCKKSTWKSYISMVRKKIPSKKIALVSVLPKYGLQQLYWSRQFNWLDCSQQWESKLDSDLTKWFDDSSNISYQTVDEPVAIDGLDIFYEAYPLVLHLEFPARIPALFLQWEAVFNSNNNSIKAGIIKTCQLWSQKNPNGRIIILLDFTKAVLSGNATSKEDIRSLMKGLLSKLDQKPVYLYGVDKESVNFTLPPHPGLLATIQKSHGIDLHCKDTVLLYHDHTFSKMAEMAGVKHISASKVLHKPALILNRLVFSSPRLPDFLQDMKTEVKEDGAAHIPLCDNKDSFHDNCISMEISPGIEALVFASDIQTIEKYEEDFKNFIQNQSENTRLQRMDTSHVSSDDEVSIQERSITRELPKWMLGTSKSSSSISRSDSVNSTTSVDSKIKSTIYVMSEQELIEVATDILKQAGREDLLKKIEEKQTSKDKICEESKQTVELAEKSSNLKSSLRKPVKCIKDRVSRNVMKSEKVEDKTIGDETNTMAILDIDDKNTTLDTQIKDAKARLEKEKSASADVVDNTAVKDRKVNTSPMTIEISSKTKSSLTLEISDTSEIEDAHYSDILDDTFCLGSKKVDSFHDRSHDSGQNSVLCTRKNQKISHNAMLTRSKGAMGNVEKMDYVSNTDSSQSDVSLNIDPSKLFQDLEDHVSDKRTGAAFKSKKPKIENVTNKCDGTSSTLRRKPDLSFLDDIFG